jgi:Yip1 domain
MSPLEAQPATEATAPLSQWQRVANTFTAPSKTFADIKRGNRSWWMPLLIAVFLSYVLFAAITLKIGWRQTAENTLRMNQKSEERMEQAPPEQRATIMKFTQYSMEGGFAASPVFIIVGGLIIAVVLWGTINFIFGGKATFSDVFAAWFYAILPGTIKSILGTVVIFAGIAPESFNLANFAPTNVGAFLSPQDTGPALYKLATAIDFTTIWYLALMGIGLSVVAKVKRSSGYTAVFGWWVLVVLIGVGWAAAFG